MTRWLPLAFVLIAVPSFRQTSEAIRACDERSTQMELNICADQEARRLEGEMNDKYRRLLSMVAAQPRANTRIQASQRTWIMYRDASIEAMFPEADKQRAYGSMYPMSALLTRASLTRQRIDVLDELLEQHDPGPK